MSPSLSELFGPPGTEAENDFEFNMDKLMGGVDTALAESTRFRDDTEDEPEPEPEPEVEPEPEPETQPQGSPAETEEPAGESAETTTPPVVAADPLGLLPPERRAALLAIDEASQRDPAVQQRVLQALQPQVAAPVVPTLPEEIEEGSVAARLWHDQQETRVMLANISAGQRAQHEAFVKQSAVSAADAAGDEFAARYPQLEPSDVAAIAQSAANSGLVSRLTTGVNPENLKPAFTQALESALWTDERHRAKVIGDAAITKEPTVLEKDKAEAPKRKRKLSALSSAATPSAAPSGAKSPLETRVDGRLTPQSRLSVVREMASKLNRESNEGNY